MQAAGTHLLSQFDQAIADICTVTQAQELRNRLSDVLSGYDIRWIESSDKHPDLAEKLKLFIDGKRLEGLSEITLYDYGLQLRIFADQVSKRIEDITTDDIRTYLGKFSHLKRSSISGKLSILKSFFGWLVQEEMLAKDPTKRIKPPKQEKRLPKALTVEELELLRESCKTIRQRALVEVMYATGCRLSEVQGLDRDDINFQTMSARVIGKGNKEREVLFSYKAIYHLRKYLMQRQDDCPALIVTERRPFRRLGTRCIQRDIGKIAEHSGIQKNISPHTLRHTFATLTLNNGAELAVIQRLLGHTNPGTTQRYAVLSDERKREQYKRHLVQ